MEGKRIFAIITARGGSKGVLRKNVRKLLDKPLIAYTILAAIKCPYISRCFVTTEDNEIKAVSQEWGAEIIDRPIDLAGDFILSKDVVRHALEKLKKDGELPDYFALLQPTSPLRTELHLSSCIELFFKSNSRCAMSVTEIEHHPYKSFYFDDEMLKPLFGEASIDKPRQTLPRIFRQNGAIYLMESKLFLEENSFFVQPVMPFIMESDESIDIDNDLDIMIVENILKKRIKYGK